VREYNDKLQGDNVGAVGWNLKKELDS